MYTDINKSQPRRLAEANSQNVKPGDIYIALHLTMKNTQHIGIVVKTKDDGSEGFSCLYNHMRQDKEELLKDIKSKDYSPDHFFGCEHGIFLRRGKDGRLEPIAATGGFLDNLDCLEDLLHDF